MSHNRESSGGAPVPRLRYGFCFGEEGFDEIFGVEGFDVFGFFAEADEFDGQIELVADGDDDAALGGAVEFGEEDAGDVDGLEEFLGLADGVLAGGGVEDEEDFVRGAGDAFFDDAGGSWSARA